LEIRDNTEIITNDNGTIYHLGINAEMVASIIITVGDQNRVDEVAKYLSKIHQTHQTREFRTIFGEFRGREITIISTGIGTDNVDIVINELDFLANWDLKEGKRKSEHRQLKFIRLGTSGSIHSSVELDTIVYSKMALSADGLMDYYNHSFDEMQLFGQKMAVIPCDKKLERLFENHFQPSFTLTAKGFYGPQMRSGALEKKYSLSDLTSFNYQGTPLGNIEMETAGIYGLSHVLGHQALSINAILADRQSGEFSNYPQKMIQEMIEQTFEILKNHDIN
jgi:uridine phosphorylase